MNDKQSKQLTGINDSVLLSKTTMWMIQEAYKTLRSNIIFSLSGDGCQIIGITSVNSHDGKSVNSINIAISFAEIKKRVLLIEGDLRRPVIADVLKIEKTVGLSDVVVGEVDLIQAIYKDEIRKVDVLTAGTIPPDSTWILQSPKMAEILREIRKEYDYVFIDFPPALVVTDAVILAKEIDGYLIVVRHNTSEIDEISNVCNIVETAKGRIIGFVYNMAEWKRKKGYKNYYNDKK